MGFFGSDSTTKKKTYITTNTTTKMRDIGLTGAHATNMAAILQTGSLERQRITAGSLDTLMQTVGKTSQQLIGGASDLVRAQGEITKSQISGGRGTAEKLAPWVAIAAVAIPVLLLKK